jgi:hypothetical protein
VLLTKGFSEVNTNLKKILYSDLLNKIFLVNTLLIYPYINRLFDSQNHPILSLNKVFWIIGTPIILIGLLKNKISCKTITDKLFICIIYYLTVSLFTFSFFYSPSNEFIVREIYYSILPILCYFIYCGNQNINKESSFKIIIYSIALVAIIGLWANVEIPKPFFISAIKNSSYINFQSFYSPIIYASVGPICFGFILMDYIKIPVLTKIILLNLFLITSILTLQRAAFLGLFMCFIFFIIQKYRYKSLYLSLFTLMLVFLIIYFTYIQSIDDHFTALLLGEIADFNLGSVVHQRREQSFIFNDYSFLKIFFGEGFGKYSPQNKEAILTMPDASYHRLFNEIGVVGCSLFVFVFSTIFFKFFKSKNTFGIFFLAFVLIHFYFNRILMSIPSSYFIYALIGLLLRPEKNDG